MTDSNRYTLLGLAPGATYHVQVRSNEGGALSEWSPLFTIAVSSDVQAPKPVTGLSWVVEGTAFVGTWTAPTQNADNTPLADFKDYQVSLYSASNPAEIVTYYTTAPRFDFPYEVNSNAFSSPRASVTIEVRARDTAGNISTVVSATAVNPAPSTVTGLTVTGGVGTINSKWTHVSDADFKYYEVYASQVNGFTPGPSNLIAQTSSNAFTFNADAGQTWYVKVRAVDIFNTGSAAYASSNATSRAVTDGVAPSASPTPTVIGRSGALYVRWTGTTNNDPVTYEVHISTTTGFTPGAGTKVGDTKSTFQTIEALPGAAPSPGDPDLRTLMYDVTYYVKIIAKDDDGAAAAGTQGSGQMVRITGPDIAADTITGNNIVSGTFTGEEFAGEVFVGNKFTSRGTGGTGQGVEFGVDGFGVWRSTGIKKFYVPVGDDEDAFVDGEFIAQGLTVLGGASFQTDENEITADGALTLMRGIVAPSASPQFTITYNNFKLTTAGLITAYKTGSLGTFDLDPNSVTHIEWKTAVGGYWVINQVRPNGTRSWYFDTSGNPKDLFGTNVYFNDAVDWERWSTTEITSGPKAGVYTIFRFIPGAGTDWYISGPTGLNKYNRLNTGGVPCLGNNGTDMYVAEVVGSSLKINYHSMTPWSGGAVPTIPAATTSHASATGYAASLCCCEYNTTGTGGFDLIAGGATHRYATAERGVAYSARTIYQQGVGGNNLFPGYAGSTATGWAGATVNAESWESPVSNRRGMAWDGSNFWTFGADGFMYRHEGSSTQWDPSAVSSIWWGQITFYDNVGTTHETKPGVIKNFTMRRRAKLLFTPPAIPDNGGVDDPKQVRLFMARGATQPANSVMYLQGAVSTSTLSVTTLATATATPPTLGNFPNTTPARIRNDDDTLVISGDGSGKFSSLMIGADTVAINGPYWYGYLSGSTAWTATTWQSITGWALTANSGITHSSGTFTVPKAGRYRVTVHFSFNSNTAGNTRGARILFNAATAGDLLVPPNTGGNPTTVLHSRVRSLSVGGTININAYQNSAASIGVIGEAGGTSSWIEIEWMGP